jgi:hypothetical protein
MGVDREKIVLPIHLNAKRRYRNTCVRSEGEEGGGVGDMGHEEESHLQQTASS